jgi:hypothetical protein
VRKTNSGGVERGERTKVINRTKGSGLKRSHNTAAKARSRRRGRRKEVQEHPGLARVFLRLGEEAREGEIVWKA